jgi:hypothetical protein
MMYTVVPLERIYRSRIDDDSNNTEPEFKDIFLEHGRVVAKREGQCYIIEKLVSTQMSDYLNEAYYPGMKLE